MKTISKSIIAIMLAITAISCQSQIDLIDNKISNYKIVIPSNATDVEIKSAEELQKYLFEVSDVKLDIITDDKSKILNEINIGNTNRVQEIVADINLL